MDLMKIRRGLLMMQQSAPVVNINLWDEQWEVGMYNSSTGQARSGSDMIRSLPANPIAIEPETQYYVYSGRNINIRCLFYNASDVFIESPNALRNSVITSPANAKYMRFFTGGGYGETYRNDISINYPSTDHDYHAHV